MYEQFLSLLCIIKRTFGWCGNDDGGWTVLHGGNRLGIVVMGGVGLGA